MTGGFCPECGTPHTSGAKFCPKCGASLSSPPPSGTGTLEKAAEVVDKVSSTVSKVESTMRSAGKITQTARQLSTITIRPPAEWKVVVGEVLPVAGQKVVDTAVSTAKQQVEQKVRGEVTKQITEKIGTLKKPLEGVPQERVVPSPAGSPANSGGSLREGGSPHVTPQERPGGAVPPEQTAPGTVPHAVCPYCGTPVKSGVKFCGSCGARMGGSPPVSPATPPSPTCPGCGAAIVAGKKFCGMCGQKLG